MWRLLKPYLLITLLNEQVKKKFFRKNIIAATSVTPSSQPLALQSAKYCFEYPA